MSEDFVGQVPHLAVDHGGENITAGLGRVVDLVEPLEGLDQDPAATRPHGAEQQPRLGRRF